LGHLDVRSADQVQAWLDGVEADLVIHLAAETDVDLCEAEPDHACATNAEGTRHVALACRTAGVPMAYVSTAGVFDGEKDEPYTEEDPAVPINMYGRSKLDGEHHVRSLLDHYYIVRAGWMVGGGNRDHKFVAKIVSQLREGATTIYAVGDRWGTPTYAPDFARCFLGLLGNGPHGLYHMACHGRGTRYDVALKVLAALGCDREVHLVRVDSTFFDKTFPAPRPRSEMMRNLALERLGIDTMRPWEDALDEYLADAFFQEDNALNGRGYPLATR
jgi:dTDP-4-dehydrorhamnose reductase